MLPPSPLSSPPSAPRWLAAGTGLAGVLLGATAVMIGIGQRPAEPVVGAAMPTPAAPASPRLADSVVRTRGSVVSLRTPTRAGAGVIVDAAGHIVTNMHVIGDVLGPQGGFAPGPDGPPLVRARFVDGRELAAMVVVADREEDLAVLRLQSPDADERFAAAELGSSAALRVGDAVFAVGDPDGLSHTVSSGIVSAIGRTGVLGSVPLLQLDASMNVGNSGGPLFSAEGKLVGLIVARQRRAEGIAFALPVDHVRGFLRAVTQEGGRRSGAIGVTLDLDRTVAPSVAALGYAAGLSVAEVAEGGAAAKAGLRVEDVIVEVRGARLDALPEAESQGGLGLWFVAAVRAMFPGESLPLAVVRGAELVRIDVEVGAATDREQTFIDSEVLLGFRLDREREVPTITDVVSLELARDRDAFVGATIVGLLSRDVSDVASLGKMLAELREASRAGNPGLTVWVKLRRPDGREGVVPVSLP
jgi:S1-C subfamily serine protease